ncbi:MAG: hypothetical protein HY069_01835 [Chlamydiia bacterium]|nr:hypothetical protein [Chlamydiia bacterium]
MKSWKICKRLISFSSALLLTCCGYRWQPEYPSSRCPTVSVSAIDGDEDGNLTSEILRALNRSGLVSLVPKRGEYRLEVAIQSGDIKIIGFRRDIELISGKRTKNLIASEGRKSLAVQVTLYEGTSDQVAYGPYLISVDTDFDYVMGDSLRDLVFATPADPAVVVLPFSLGQLEPNEAAQEAAAKPIYTHLAQKIVDTIAAEW